MSNLGGYILEVQQFDCMGHLTHPKWNGQSEHIGYMDKIFKTQQDASDYYDSFNPHMRSLCALNTWCSDWDPRNCRMYIVREYYHEYLKIPQFV